MHVYYHVLHWGWFINRIGLLFRDQPERFVSEDAAFFKCRQLLALGKNNVPWELIEEIL